MNAGAAVLTGDSGRIYFKPQRCDYPSDVAFVQAFHEYKQAVTNEANGAFDKAFARAMRA